MRVLLEVGVLASCLGSMLLPVCRGTLTQKRVSASFAHRPLPSHAAGQTTLRWRESLAPGASTAVWRLPSGISADILLMAMQECKKTCTSACRCMFSFLFLFFANPFVGPCWCFCFCFFCCESLRCSKAHHYGWHARKGSQADTLRRYRPCRV